MCEIFPQSAASSVLRGKRILFVGDSIMRNIYKDLVWLITEGNLIPRSHMCDKGEESFQQDRMSDFRGMTAGRDYREVRDWDLLAGTDEDNISLSFVFITRCFSVYLRSKLEEYCEKEETAPDVIVVNSALWDINRWGPRGIQEYKENVKSLFRLFDDILFKHTQVIWMTTPPISVEIQGGFRIEQLEFQQHSMRFNIMEGNQYTATVAAAAGRDVLDMHYHMNLQIHRRSSDGIHWNPDAVRMQVNILLTHFCLSREIPLPKTPTTQLGVLPNAPLEEAIKIAEEAKRSVMEKMTAEDEEDEEDEEVVVVVEAGERRFVTGKRRLPQ